MPTYLHIEELRTDTAQKRYRNKYELRHVDYELSRTINNKGEITSDVMGGRIRVVIDVKDMVREEVSMRGYSVRKRVDIIILATVISTNKRHGFKHIIYLGPLSRD